MAENTTFTNRWGGQFDLVEEAQLHELLHSVEGLEDSEHGSVSVSDSEGWNLEFYPERILFENVEPEGGVVGATWNSDFSYRMKLASLLMAGHVDDLKKESESWT